MAIRKLDGDRVAVCPEAMQSLIRAFSETAAIHHASKQNVQSKAHQVLQKDHAFENNTNNVSE